MSIFDVWPFRRLRTYVSGAPVHADDLNELQDAVGYHRHGAIQAPIPLGLALPRPGWSYDGYGWLAPNAGGLLQFSIPFSHGTSLLDITAWWNMMSHPFDPNDATDGLGLTINHADPFVDVRGENIPAPLITDDTMGDHSGQAVRYTWDLRASPVYLVPGRIHRLNVFVGHAARRIDGLMVTLARQ